MPTQRIISIIRGAKYDYLERITWIISFSIALHAGKFNSQFWPLIKPIAIRSQLLVIYLPIYLCVASASAATKPKPT